MNKLIINILLVFLLNGTLLSFDHCFKSFKLNKKKLLVELYYKINSKDLNYSIKDLNNIYTEKVDIDLTIKKQGVNVISDNWEFTHTTQNKDTAISMFDKRVYSLYPGQYNYKLQFNPENSDEIINEGNFTVDNYNKNIQISDLIIAHLLETANENTPENFTKNNFYLVPNISKTYRGDKPFIKFYYETYNIDTSDFKSLNINYTIRNGINEILYNETKNKTIKSRNVLDIGIIPVDTLKNGTYKLTVELLNNDGDILIVKSEKFYVMDPDKEFALENLFIEDISFEQSPFSIMNSNQIEIEFEKMRHILSKYEREQFNTLSTLRAKQRAIYKYWKDRDPDTTTAVNEFLAEYAERVQYTETYFSKGDILKGWNSERGRVLLKYGFPTQRETYRSKEGKNAAEEWFYSDLYGGSYFFFVDRLSDNRFQLVHSTVPGEVKNYNWFDEYKPAIEDDGSPRYKSTRIDANRDR